MSTFDAEHADRLAHVHGGNLAEGDLVFRWWNDMIASLHAETCFRHRELGLMPESHWRGYQRFITDYLRTPAAPEFWQDVGSGLSEESSGSVTGLLRQHAKENS
ncbi:MAG: hypothetical protein JSW21_12495 [Gammaproteobacteria bacterium]|nr:MAG: hypothetical protein JSW21_12495 [Gammaproteobacteria bacterium]